MKRTWQEVVARAAEFDYIKTEESGHEYAGEATNIRLEGELFRVDIVGQEWSIGANIGMSHPFEYDWGIKFWLPYLGNAFLYKKGHRP